MLKEPASLFVKPELFKVEMLDLLNRLEDEMHKQDDPGIALGMSIVIRKIAKFYQIERK